MENEAYFTIRQWRGIPEGRTLEAQKNDYNGDIMIRDILGGTLLHSCTKELLSAIRLGILVDVKIANDEEEIPTKE